jgi:uncharacterized protein
VFSGRVLTVKDSHGATKSFTVANDASPVVDDRDRVTIDQGPPGASGSAPRRIATLDVIRGVAVMGILAVNIVAFAMPEAAYLNPAAFGGHAGLDLAVWVFNLVAVDGKMRGLFSLLFGASMLLVMDRAAAKGESPARVHFSRMFWLFLLGEAHFILLWRGDILSHYAVVGCLAYFFRKLPPPKLIGLATILVALEVVLAAGFAFSVNSAEIAARAPHAAVSAVRQDQEFQRDFGVPSAEALAGDLALHRGPYPALFAHRLEEAIPMTERNLMLVGMETLGYMLLGMACFKSGLLTGQWSRVSQLRWVAIGFGVGIPAFAVIAWNVFSHDFALFPLLFGVLALSTPVRVLMIVGWACLIVLLTGSGGPIAARIAATGRMALSNYLGTSLLCSTLFYGYGFGLYGQLSRASLYLVVFAVWALMLLWSKPWLEHFRYGPFEWLWRSLARMRFQPMRGAAVLGSMRPST